MNNSYKILILSNATEWCYYCWRNYVNMNSNVVYYKYAFPLSVVNNFLYKILYYIYSKRTKLGSIFRFLIRMVIGFFFCLDQEKKNIIILYDWNPLAADKVFVDSIRKKYPNVLIVYVFTNIVKYTGAKTWGVIDDLNSIYDVVYAFDKVDAENYNFEYQPLIYSKEIQEEYSQNLETDIFYVGKAKDRLDIIHTIYKQAIEEGLNCDFNITNVPDNLKELKYGINYNNVLPYNEVIKRIKKSKCLLDVIQGESTGLTIKVAEAVVYNKKLLTNNTNAINELQICSDNVLLYDKIKQLKDFVCQKSEPYGKYEQNYFSPELFIDRLIRKYDSKFNCQQG